MVNVSAITCVDRNWGIGKTNPETGVGELLFDIKKDMQIFTSITLHQVVVMGENTLLSLPGRKPLPNRVNVVLSPQDHIYPGFICIHTLPELIDYIELVSISRKVYVIGGGMLYKTLLPYCESVYVTKVQTTDPTATVFFPNLDEDTSFIKSAVSDPYEEKGLQFYFTVYSRIFNEPAQGIMPLCNANIHLTYTTNAPIDTNDYKYQTFKENNSSKHTKGETTIC